MNKEEKEIFEMQRRPEERAQDMLKRDGAVGTTGDEIYRDEILPHHTDIKDPPTIALHLLAKNAESVIERLLSNVGPYISEVVAAINDTTDDTMKIIESWCKEHNKRCDLTEVTYEKFPGLYIMDVPETYQVGRPLCGETLGGPFTGSPILADWATARNIVWEKCTADWRLFLDADDVMVDPQNLWGLCLALEENHVDMALTRYNWAVDELDRPRGASFRERIARNKEEIRWIYPIHEVLWGSMKHAFIKGSCITIDKRDSAGEGIRIPGRNFKILYQFARTHDWEIGSRMMLQLAEAGKMMPEFVQEAVRIYLERSDWLEERGWAYRLLGEMFESLGKWPEAAYNYELALKEHPGTKAAFSLCRARYNEGKFLEAIAAYEEGLLHQAVLQVVDDGPLYADMSKILVADAHYRIWSTMDEGDEKEARLSKALEVLKAARSTFPKVAALEVLEEEMRSKKQPRPLHIQSQEPEAGSQKIEEVSP